MLLGLQAPRMLIEYQKDTDRMQDARIGCKQDMAIEGARCSGVGSRMSILPPCYSISSCFGLFRCQLPITSSYEIPEFVPLKQILIHQQDKIMLIYKLKMFIVLFALQKSLNVPWLEIHLATCGSCSLNSGAGN